MYMLDGINHFGDLLRRIREVEGMQQADLARKARVDASTLSALENNGTGGEKTISKIIETLDLTQEEKEFLIGRFYYGYEHRKDQEEKLCGYRFSLIKDVNNKACEAALTSLMFCPYPAFLYDNLWFVHVFNSSMLKLFDITEKDLTIGKWPWCHVMGIKYAPGSKLKEKHGDKADIYFPRALKLFFEDTGSYFFTAQMQALRNALWNLSNYKYQRWWRGITSFAAPFENLDLLPRQILYKKQWISLEVKSNESFTVMSAKGNRLRYRRTTWEPLGAEAEAEVNIISEVPQKLYFAADYIEDYNDWPEIKEELQR